MYQLLLVSEEQHANPSAVTLAADGNVRSTQGLDYCSRWTRASY